MLEIDECFGVPLPRNLQYTSYQDDKAIVLSWLFICQNLDKFKTEGPLMYSLPTLKQKQQQLAGVIGKETEL